MYRRQSLHFVAAAPDRLIIPARLWLRQTTLPHQQRRPIELRGQALWPVVALLSALHHRLPLIDGLLKTVSASSFAPCRSLVYSSMLLRKVLVSALWRRDGVGSLAHRAGDVDSMR